MKDMLLTDFNFRQALYLYRYETGIPIISALIRCMRGIPLHTNAERRVIEVPDCIQKIARVLGLKLKPELAAHFAVA
jgi:hypothetical protein